MAEVLGYAPGAWKSPLLAAGLCLLFSAAMVALADSQGIDISSILRDPSSEFDVPHYAGGISFIGITMLILTSGCLALAAAVDRPHRRLFLLVGVYSMMLALDDRFILHERHYPRLGIEEEVLMGIYGLIGLVILWCLWRGPLRAWTQGLCVAIGIMGLAVVADLGHASYVIEDLLKVASFGGWFGFWLALTAHRCRTAASAETPSAEQH
ncbi:hypothetical protein [Tropicimonas sediminicola]|uniref:hypothetical protein n=1 Tax=Tropicimonas sediminicola TaxID=1031541 RepID=UPI0015959CB4|nr:hypothetical protein [Tropicimonas sediminicola]